MRNALCLTLCLVLAACASAPPPTTDVSDPPAAGAKEANEAMLPLKRRLRIQPVVDQQEIVDIAGPSALAPIHRVVDSRVSVELGSGTPPEALKQIALVVENCRHVVLRDGWLRGFKVGIHLRNCDNVIVEECRFFDMFRQRLGSTPEAEDGRDWLWPHNNDKCEWLANYGAAIYLENCRNCVVRRCTGRDGQNGVILANCENCAVVDCDFSWHSGWGCALWRSSKCEVSGSRFDFCVRGYSDGKYARGQDSAGILMFEQCNDNLIANNSATHGGDGFFLYAGHETTQRTGKGGCNRNIVINNDFSCAVANGIEATFSDGNCFIGNRLSDCDYGIWAGYSFNTLILDNVIERSLTAGIAIEHGQDNVIDANRFKGNRRGLWLWWDDDPGLTGGVYGQNRRTSSEGYRVVWNWFDGDKVAIELADTSNVIIENNDFARCETLLRGRGNLEMVALAANNFRAGKLDLEDNSGVKLGANWKPGHGGEPFDTLHSGIYMTLAEELRARIDAMHSTRDECAANAKANRPGREGMMIGPYGPVNPLEGPYALEFHTAPGRYWLVGPATTEFEVCYDSSEDETAFEVAPAKGHFPAMLIVRPKRAGAVTYHFGIWWGGPNLPPRNGQGNTGTRCFGTATRIDWSVRFWKWESAQGHEGPADFKALTATEPLKSVTRDSLRYDLQHRAPEEGVPADYFATVAETEIELTEGAWKFKVTSDDGVRVYLNDELIIENWTTHGPTQDIAQRTLKAGKYRIRIEHFEREGWSALQFDMEGW